MRSKALGMVLAALLSTAFILAIALEDPAPAFIPLLAALPLRSRASFGKWERRRWTRKDAAAGIAFFVGLSLTLLMPDGLARWVVCGALILGYLASVRILNPDA